LKTAYFGGFIVVSVINTIVYAFHDFLERCWNGWERFLPVVGVSACAAIAYRDEQTETFQVGTAKKTG
jgi:hypothetical protein